MRVLDLWVKYKHLKTGNIYRACEYMATNATNANDGQLMMVYTNGDKIFVREAEEFLKKFELIELGGEG